MTPGIQWKVPSMGPSYKTMCVMIAFILVLLNPVKASSNFHFTQSVYNATIKENAPPRTNVTSEQKMGIYISDPSLHVEYDVTSGDGIFSVHSHQIGDFSFLRVRVKPCQRSDTRCRKLNRESKSMYTISVTANGIQDDVVVATASAEVRIIVEDINDALPVFHSLRHQTSIPEDLPVGSSVAVIQAVDADIGSNGEIYYSLKRDTNIFAIHPSSGEVTLTRPLTEVDERTFRLEVVAKDRGQMVYGDSPGSESPTALLRVTVTAVNKYAPKIIVTKLPKLTRTDNVFAEVQVIDADNGRNGEIHSLDLHYDDLSSHFQVRQSEDGDGRYQVMVLSNRPPLPPAFNLTLVARDNGSPVKVSFYTLTANLDETMSYQSLFVSSFFNVSISELTPVLTPIVIIAPHDAPTDILQYSVLSETDVPFAVMDGVLIVSDSLEEGTKAFYNISLQAFDQFGEYLAMCHVSIYLIDENNHSPVFDQDHYEVEFDENQESGTFVTQVTATDSDEGENGYVFYSIANLNQVPFRIDYMTGVITSTKLLDFETMRSRYTLLVRASDWGSPYQRESQVQVAVNLGPVNDNPPQFEKVNCSGTISTAHPVGVSIALLPAVDFDSSTREIVVSDGNVNDLFYVDPLTGNLTLKRRIADDDPRFYQLKIMVTDGPDSSNFMTTNITIVGNRRNPSAGGITCGSTDVVQQFAAMAVQREKSNAEEDQFPGNYQNLFNSNPNAPQFHVDFPESITIPENSPVGSSVFTILASDPDQGYNGMVLFSITSGNVGYSFKLTPESGDLVVMKPLDREHLDTYHLTITLSDLGKERKSTSAQLSVIIEDSNDNPPIFENERYVVEVPENIETGMTFLHVSATDVDIGENGEVQYFLEGNPEAFQVGISSGDVRVAANLDREENEVIELVLIAQDMSAEEPLSTKTSLSVHLLDINDNAPRCILPLQKFKVREDLPLRATLFQVKAVDPDAGRNSSIRYDFMSGHESKFEIDPDYGIVRLVDTLDFEETPIYNITVELQDGGVPPLSSTCDLVVEVIDVNENLHPPVFPDFVLTASVEENAEVGTEVIAVTATDMDDGRDGEISYFIRGGSGLGFFTVDEFGIIRTKVVLDRESKSHYWLTLYAQDNAVVPLHSIVEVYIEVSDLNDNAPFPTLPVFRGYVPENSDVGVEVIRVDVKDLDEAENLNISFSIPSKKIRRMFQIDQDTGMISTASNRLDRETKQFYLFEVDISDNGDPGHSSTANVIIEILDENDNTPVFHQKSFVKWPVRPVELAEGEQSIIMRVFAYDKDEGENATVSYIIPTSGQERQTRFHVDAQTGEVKCSRSLMEGESFTLMIDAFDNGPIQQKSRLTLLLTVIDPVEPSSLAPEFIPFFADLLYENVAPGMFVTTVDAFDADTDSNDIVYSITGGNEDAVFTNERSAIFVAKPLDAEIRTSYDLEITASDGYNTATSILHLEVNDANEFAPVFEHDQYEVAVPENIASGKQIIQVQASDRDITSRLFYSITSTAHHKSKSLFKINSDTGEIFVKRSLDHEDIRQHILVIKVRDVGYISFHSFTTVVVNVLDYNDHVPHFGADHYEGQVFETAEPGTVVVQVQGYDGDKDVNAELRYSIVSGNAEDAFHIDPVLGNIMTSRALDIEAQAKYSLRVQVTDLGTPPLSNTATVNITVVLSNSAPPRFVRDEYITEIEENLPPGEFVLHPDVISKSSVFFEIAGGNERDHFEIDGSSGVVLSKFPLDYEMVEVYNLTIKAINMIGGSALCHLIIHVLDVNDNAPIFVQEVYEGSITESSPMNTVVSDVDNRHLVVGAVDLDFDQNARLVYSIVEEDARRYFVIDENTGAVRSLTSLDHETHPTFEFHVSVHDSGSRPLMARSPALVKVSVQDINDSPPVFAEEDYEASLLLPTFEGVLVSQVVATDPDSVSLSNLYYSIRSGNSGSHFKIVPTTGEVRVAEPERIEGRYHLQVEVSDGLYTSQAQVRIITKQTASSDLQFHSNQTDATVVENSTGVSYIAQVAVVGTGLNEPVAYTILNPSTCFSINSRSGSIRTTGVPLDRETKDRYMLVVEARDDRRPPRIARTVVFVEVTDVNDNSPVFVHHEYNAIVQVDAKVGEIVRTVLALDEDDGANGEVEYTLMGGAEGYFNIDPVTGDIRVQRVMGLDVENRNFTLLVQASDKGQVRRSSIVEVPIIVRNKAMPVFREQYYSASIPEDIQLFSSVVQIEAISPSGRKLIYSISNGNPYKHFDITPFTGVITVTGSLDYESQNQYGLTVQASDTLTGVSSSVIVDISITDVNDMAPRFPMQVYHKVLSEGHPVSSTIIQLSASDQDSDAFNRIRYSMETDSEEVLSLFRVDASSGILFTLRQLDHETSDSYNITIVASDNGVPPLKGLTLVSLKITDMNDNPPSFMPQSYQCIISQGARRGSFVGRVSAIDPDKVDEGVLVYSIVSGNDDMAFSINSATGVISLASSREPDLKGLYELTVAATDQVFTSSASVRVQVTPINKQAPSFMFPNYNIFFAENETNGSSIFQVEAIDEDDGIFGEIEYAILGDLARSFFRIVKDTGEIKSRLVIDQDVLGSKTFQIPVLATDGGGRTGYTNVNLNLRDRNNYAPRFELSKYQGYVQAGASEGTTVLRVRAIDKDFGSNALVSYHFSESTNPEILQMLDINPQTGELFTRRTLPHDGFHGQFFLRAADDGLPSMTTVVPVEVTVLPQQTVPSFDPATNLQSLTLSEDTDIGTVLTRFHIEEGNASFVYSLVPGNTAHTNSPVKFSISRDGELSLTSSLDHELTSWFTLTIKAVPMWDGPPVSAFHELAITISDVNDNAPIFEQQRYHVRIEENSAVGSSVIQVRASDADVDETITYEIVEDDTGYTTEAFQIHPNTGLITTVGELNRETVVSYTIQVRATDGNDRDEIRHTTVASVEVSIVDMNDSPPHFLQAVYNAVVREDAETGTIVTTVEAHDGDIDHNADLTYYITQGDPCGHFLIDCLTGDIMVAKTLDRESRDRFILNVTASDGVFTHNTKVIVEVEDVNTHAPTFLQVSYKSEVMENQEEGLDILQVEATDLDAGENGLKAYSLRGEGSEMFHIDSESGMLQTFVPLDYETQRFFQFEVVASDGGGLEDTALLSISVMDENDNPPGFTQSPYNVSVSENTTSDSLLTRVQAVDRDSGAYRQFTFSFVDPEDDSFLIDQQSGIITLNRILDREVRSEYNLTLKVSDPLQPNLFTISNLIIDVLDENDNEPMFEHDLYNVTVSENVAVRSVILRVRALSADEGLNALVTYAIVSGNEHSKFAIDGVTGQIILRDALDFEREHAYYLTVKASDAGERPLSDTTMVNIYVTDFNDNSPVFSQDIYNSEVTEAARVGDSVVQVVASDIDSGRLGDVSYTIVRGDLFDLFTIGQKNGLISLAAELDREQSPSYSLVVRASDGGDPVRFEEVTVKVSVVDINDNPPRFSSHNYTIVRKEDTSLNTLLIQFNVTDADSPGNGPPFAFSLVSGDVSMFHLTPDGALTNNIAFNRDVRETYTLTVRATDSGKPALSSDVSVKVIVVETKNAPVVSSPLMVTINSYQNAFPGGFIAKVTATDEDPYDVLEYAIVSDPSQAFQIEPVNGKIIAEPDLDVGVYPVNVSVGDGEFTSFARVDVELKEVTSEMLQNSAVVRFADLTPEKFIAYGEIFKHTVANIVREPESENVQIVSIQRADSDPSDVDVLFAVKGSSDRNRGYFKSKTLVKRINASISSLQDRMLLEVGTVFGEPCSTNACQVGFRCEGMFVLDYSEVVTIATEVVAFVSAKYYGEHECVCVDESICGVIPTTTEIYVANPCDSSPCSSNELCVPTSKGGYTCSCIEENDPLCEGASYTPLHFTGDSFVEIQDPELSTTSTQLSVAIHTTASDGVIMYGDGDFDFSILEIEEGLVYFHFECGSGEAHIRLTQQRVDDGDWHQVAIKRHGNSATVTLDGQYSSSGTAPGFNRELNLNTLVFGGNVLAGGQRRRRSPTVVDGFSGCMGDVNLNGKPLNLKGEGTSGPELMECPSKFRQACQHNPCQNGGSCLDHGYRYQCVCPPGFTGHHCEHHLGHCTSKPCANGGTCHTFEAEFWCSCPTPFFGKLCLAESCADRPCQNKGVCIDSPLDGLSCNCSGTGYEGIYCQQPATSCTANPCLSTEECRNDGDTYVCCGIDSEESVCNMVSFNDPNVSSGAYGITIMEIAIIGGIIFFILIVVLILLLGIRTRRKRRRDQQTRNRAGDRYHGVYGNDPDNFPPSNKLEYPIHAPPFQRAPPEIPEYPTGYTRSTNTSMNDLGSDISEQYRGQQISHAPSLPPLPSHSASDNESITKPSWDFDTPSNQGSYIEVRGSSKNLPIAPTKLQHSQPSILPIGHHPHNIPKDDPPAYTAARHRPTGADTISMSSINTANTDNDADTLRANTNNSMSDGVLVSDSLTPTNIDSSKSKTQDELISSSESVSKALENISDTEVSDEDNNSVSNEKTELRVDLEDEEKEEKEPHLEEEGDVNENLAEKEPLVDKVVTPGTPKSVRFNMIPEVNQFQTDIEGNELQANRSQEGDDEEESDLPTEGAPLEKRESGDGLESEVSDISLTEDEDLIGDGDLSAMSSEDEEDGTSAAEVEEPFLSKESGEGCPSSSPMETSPSKFTMHSGTQPLNQARNLKDPRKKGMQWDYSDCTPKPESVYNLNIPQGGRSSSPTSTHYTQGEFDDDDDEYVGEETDYPYDEDDHEDFSITRATEEFQQMLRDNYSTDPDSLRHDSEDSPVLKKDYQQHPNKYMPAHKVSQNSVIPHEYEDGATGGPHPTQRSRLPRRGSYDRTTSAEFGDYPDRTSANLDNLSMSAYTDTNASCSDVSGLCDQESDALNGYESMDDQIKDISHQTDL